MLALLAVLTLSGALPSPAKQQEGQQQQQQQQQQQTSISITSQSRARRSATLLSMVRIVTPGRLATFRCVRLSCLLSVSVSGMPH